MVDATLTYVFLAVSLAALSASGLLLAVLGRGQSARPEAPSPTDPADRDGDPALEASEAGDADDSISTSDDGAGDQVADETPA